MAGPILKALQGARGADGIGPDQPSQQEPTDGSPPPPKPPLFVRRGAAPATMVAGALLMPASRIGLLLQFQAEQGVVLAPADFGPFLLPGAGLVKTHLGIGALLHPDDAVALQAVAGLQGRP